MRDFTREALEDGRPTVVDAEEAVDFCLVRLYEDQTHEVTDTVVAGLTFEELLGALLMARDSLRDEMTESPVKSPVNGSEEAT